MFSAWSSSSPSLPVAPSPVTTSLSHQAHPSLPSISPSHHLYCGTPLGGAPCPPFAPPIITAGCCPPPPCICCCTSGRYLTSCQKLQIWQPTSWYGFRLKGISGTKQKVNHSQRFMTRPLKLPQFWHCTVMCSAPLRGDWKAGGVSWVKRLDVGVDVCVYVEGEMGLGL